MYIIKLLFVEKDTLAFFQAMTAPVLIPLAPAVLMAAEVYNALKLDTPWPLALTVSIASWVGVEALGGASSYTAVLMAKRRQWFGLFLALLGIALYIGLLVMSLVYFEAVILAAFAVMTPVAFIVYGLLAVDKQIVRDERSADRLAIDEINAQRLLINARARLAKAEQPVYEPLDTSILSSNGVQSSNGQTGQAKEVTELGQAVYNYLDQNGKASARTIAAAVGCSPQAALDWRKEWEAVQE